MTAQRLCRYCKTCNPVQSALTKPTIAIQSSVICTLQTSRRLFLLAKIALCQFDKHLYKNRNLVERFFCRIKQFRRIATRYDKLAQRFASFVALAAAVIWLA